MSLVPLGHPFPLSVSALSRRTVERTGTAQGALFPRRDGIPPHLRNDATMEARDL